MRKFAFFFVLIVLFNLVAASVYAKPLVNWSPKKVTLEITVGETKDITVDLNFIKSQKNINLRIVPELLSILSVEPDKISSVESGQTIPITLHFNTGSEINDGILDGVVQVRTGKRNLAKPLPVIVNVISNPLMDIDNNGDGVWDDIQSYIDQKYSDEDELHGKLYKYVISMQHAIIDSSDQALSLNAANDLQRSIECLYALKGSDSIDIKNDVKAAFLNSKARSRAYLMFNNQLGGHVFPSTSFTNLESACQNQ